MDPSIGKAVADTAATHSATERELTAQRVARVLGGVALFCGALVLIGWIFQIDALIHATAKGGTMKPNTALGFILLGALLLAAKTEQRAGHGLRWRTALAVLLLLLGLLTGAEYVFSIDLGIDRLLIVRPLSDPTLLSTRTSELAALSFTLIGFAMLVMDSQRKRAQALAEILLLAVFGIGYVSTIGYLFDKEELYRAGQTGGALSVQGATLFASIAAALLLARPKRGLARILARKDVRGMLLRRLLPTVLLLAPIVHWLQMQASLSARPFDAIFVALGNIVLLTVLVWWFATTIQEAQAARDRAEATRITSEERMQWALEAAGGAAWEWDLTANRAWWSQELYRLWDVEIGTTVTWERLMEWIDPRDRGSVASALEQATNGHGRYSCVFRITTRDGGERWIEARGRAGYDANGQPVRLLGISIDVSAQKKVELALRESNRALETSNIELQRFAYVASHDLQTPLRSVASFAELLQARYSAALPREANEWLGRIRGSIDRMHRLISDLLLYSQVESQARHFTIVSMDESLLRAMHLLAAPIRETGATIEHSPLPSVNGDATQLTGVLVNLIGNAIKYQGPDPPRITVSASASANEWLFCVADNGIGIEPKHFERIFEMFERLHSAANHPGTGIGLAICRSVIQRHGGRIWVESELGKGSKFFFTIPQATLPSPPR